MPSKEFNDAKKKLTNQLNNYLIENNILKMKY